MDQKTLDTLTHKIADYMAEIDRLRAENANRDELITIKNKRVLDLEAENAKLREALEKIKAHDTGAEAELGWIRCRNCEEMDEIARNATDPT